jgi:hypothetical protein
MPRKAVHQTRTYVLLNQKLIEQAEDRFGSAQV